jgi:hypothetical protein
MSFRLRAGRSLSLKTQAGQSPRGASPKIFPPQLSQTLLAVFICWPMSVRVR